MSMCRFWHFHTFACSHFHNCKPHTFTLWDWCPFAQNVNVQISALSHFCTFKLHNFHTINYQIDAQLLTMSMCRLLIRHYWHFHTFIISIFITFTQLDWCRIVPNFNSQIGDSPQVLYFLDFHCNIFTWSLLCEELIYGSSSYFRN